MNMHQANNSPPFTDTEGLRRNARSHTEHGAVTTGYSGDSEVVVEMLNHALASELVCVLRYRRHHFVAQGLVAGAVAAEFLAHAGEELGHADQLAARIVQLNGAPDFNPVGMAERAHAQYIEGETLLEMIRENLVAERIAIDAYREMIAYLADDDPTTRRMLEGILAVEETHATDMADLLAIHRLRDPETEESQRPVE
jgi:bacterioferritin